MLKDNQTASTTLPDSDVAPSAREARALAHREFPRGAPSVPRARSFCPRCAAALCVAVMVLTGFAGCVATPSTRRAQATRRGFEQVLQSVVRIDVREMDFQDGAARFDSGVGSGVILSADGLILTNAHVATPRAVEISVTLASLERVGASLVGWDHWTDLAVLRLDLEEMKRRGLTFSHAEFGDSDKLVAGQTVYAVGTPHGLTRTVTKGIISNTNRYFEASDGVRGYETGYFNTWLQTDAAINPGNSGGPLVAEDGLVIGINSRTYLGAENLGFAIPANIARTVAQKLVETGKIERSYIGVIPGALRDLESFYSLQINRGMLVNSVDPGSPASRAGIRAGDVVLALDGASIDGRFPEQLPPIQNRIASAPIGSSLRLTVKRGAQEMEVSVVTEALESRVGEEWAFEKWGMSVRKVSRAFARENRLPDEAGVIVMGTQPAFPAEKAGLTRGDIVTKINSQTIESLDQLKTIYRAFEAEPASLLVEALRNRSVSFFVLKP